MNKIHGAYIVCILFQCMQFHASSDFKKNDTSVMKIRHTSATHSASIKNENLISPDDLGDFDSCKFDMIYDYLQQGFDALCTHADSMTFSDFLQYETGCVVDTRKELDAVIVQKAENFIAEGIKDRFWQKLMADALSYKADCKAAWISGLITSPFLMSSSNINNPIITYVIAHRRNFTKSEFLKCIHNKNMQGQTVFDLATEDYRKHFEFIDMVIELEPNIYLDTSDNIIPLLSWAIKNNKTQVYNQLVRVHHKKIDFNLQDSQGWTALHYAVYQGDFYAMQLLLTFGLNRLHINMQDNKGNSALHWAWDIEILSCLLQESGIDINIQNHEGQTTLHQFAILEPMFHELMYMESMYHEPFTLLLESNAQVDIQDNKGQTPLHIAVKCDSGKTTLALLNHKASKEIVDHHGRTPLQLAKTDEIKELFARP